MSDFKTVEGSIWVGQVLRRGAHRLLRILVTVGLVIALTVTGGVTAAVAKPSECGGIAWAPPGGTWWGPVSTSPVSVWGRPGYQQSYRWKVQGNIPTLIVAEGKGAPNDRGGWYGVGIDDKGGSASVPWGNVIGNPKFRVMSLSVTGAFVEWSCS
jgi:hypothetical protein